MTSPSSTPGSTPASGASHADMGEVVTSSKFRKKPVVVEAHQWLRNGDHPLDGDPNTEGEVVRYFRRPESEYAGKKTHDACGYAWHCHGWIDTLEGGHTVCPCDWIITGVQGEHYPCKPDIFEATYEVVDGCPACGSDDTEHTPGEGCS